jgi:hypothetical protein
MLNDLHLQNADIHLMGVHKLTTTDLEGLGRWKSKSKDPNHCPEYMVRTARNKKKKKKKAELNTEEETVDVQDLVRFRLKFVLTFKV